MIKATDINLSEVNYNDIRCLANIGQAWSEGKRRNKVHGYNYCIRTRLDDFKVSEWIKIAKSLISKNNEDELYLNFKEYYAKIKWADEKYVLGCFVDRLFDDLLWVGFIPFNQKYRPDIIKDMNFVSVKNECCDEFGLITIVRYEYDNKTNYCPVCGRFSSIEYVNPSI